MAQFSSWFSRVFSGDSTRGLSGDVDRVNLNEGGGSFYSSKLRLHTSDQDLVADPARLWDTGGSRKRRGGVSVHLAAEAGEGVASFTDVLVILSEEDFARTQDPFEEPWEPRARTLLQEQAEQFCEKNGFQKLFPKRPFQFTFLRDGAPEMGGDCVGLKAGQFVTGLLPNRYCGPGPVSVPVIAIYLNIPGRWDGYREVGRLWSDQILFTLGTHWLDNFAHAGLKEVALYRLQQYPDGSLVHLINPDYQDRYTVKSVPSESGPAVLAIADRASGPVAYLVLAVLSATEQQAAAAPPPSDGPKDWFQEEEGLRLANISIVDGRASQSPSEPALPVSEPAPAPPVPLSPIPAPAAAQVPGPAAPMPAVSPAPPAPAGRATPFVPPRNIPPAPPLVAAPEAQAPARPPEVGPPPRIPGLPAPTSAQAAQATAPDPEPSPADSGAFPRPTPPANFALAGEGLEVRGKPTRNWNMTIVPDAMEERILTLKERGALLQKVHFSSFMDGYDVYVGKTGQLGTAILEPVATFQVRKDKVAFVAHGPEVLVGGRPLPPDKPMPLKGEVEIRVGASLLEYRDLSRVTLDGWPYLGEIRRAASSTYMVFGGTYRIGRDRRCKVRLPDEPHNENIVWRLELRDTDTIRSRTGDIPKSRFYNDSIMVASEHAEIDLSQEPVLCSVARHCFTYVRRGGDLTALLPTSKESGIKTFNLAPGDEILVGNNLFEVSYPPGTGAPPAPRLTAEDLARAAVTVGEPEQAPTPRPPAAVPHLAPQQRPAATAPAPTPAPAPARASAPAPLPAAPPAPADPPAAAGLGESGAAPPRMRLNTEGFDSILGLEAPQARGLGRDLEELPVMPGSPVDAPPASGLTPGSTEMGRVVAVDEAVWQLELSRPASLVHVGWMVSREIRVGNHNTADVVLPENQSFAGQPFAARDYFRVAVRGRRGRVVLQDAREARLLDGLSRVTESEKVEDVSLEVVRRDQEGEEDFCIGLLIRTIPWLPDPRARLLQVDVRDRMVAGLFTVGLPLRTARRLKVGPLVFQATFDGQALKLADYLATYRRPDGGFVPFFVRQGEAPFRTAPEDGAVVLLRPGDMILAGIAVLRFQIN